MKSGDEGAILQSLEDAEQRLADVPASAAADKSRKNGTSPQTELGDEQKGLDGHNADDSQIPRKRARLLPIEEMSIHSKGDKTESNKTSVLSKTSSVRLVLNLEQKSLKE